MKLLVLLVLILVSGVVHGIQQFIDTEYILGVDQNVIEGGFREILKAKYNLEVVKHWNMGQTRLFLVIGEESDVVSVSELPGVKFWQRNGILHALQCDEHPSPQTWGLDRIDQVAGLPYADPLEPSATYNYGEQDGENVSAYIVDTGVQIDHPEFGARAVWGFTAIGLIDGSDINGHGTHVAGIVGANTLGVAKMVNLIAVKVLDAVGSGTSADVVSGLDWVLSDHTAAGANARTVVNLSFGVNGSDQAVETAVQALVDAGATCCIAAGGDGEDACGYSPARIADALTVGATDINDTAAWFTNYGPCVDIYAPGVDIHSTSIGSNYQTMNGTSMAAPHVTGVVARYMSSEVEPPTPSDVATYIKRWASPDRLEFSSGQENSTNLLLWSGCPMP